MFDYYLHVIPSALLGYGLMQLLCKKIKLIQWISEDKTRIIISFSILIVALLLLGWVTLSEISLENNTFNIYFGFLMGIIVSFVFNDDFKKDND